MYIALLIIFFSVSLNLGIVDNIAIAKNNIKLFSIAPHRVNASIQLQVTTINAANSWKSFSYNEGAIQKRRNKKTTKPQ